MMSLGNKILLCLSILMTLYSSCHCNKLCQQLHSVTEVELEAVPRDILPEDLSMKLKCYARCLLQRILGADGRLDLQRAANSEWSSAKLEPCKRQNDKLVIKNKEDQCNYAAHILNCFNTE